MHANETVENSCDIACDASLCSHQLTGNDVCSSTLVTNSLGNDHSETSVTANNQLLAASFIAKLKSNSSIPASAVDEVVNAVTEFFGCECIRALKDKTLNTLANANVDISSENVQTLMVDFDHATNMFDGLNTKYKQMKYFKQSGFYIEPETFEIGSCRLDSQRIDGNITLIPKKSTGQHIPMRKVFQKFFELPDVFDQAVAYVNNAKNNTYTDFINGKLWKSMLRDDSQTVFPYVLILMISSQLTRLGLELQFTK
jgi:hypothetical protein